MAVDNKKKSEAVHVPAWKKLGLRLKFARDQDDGDDTSSEHDTSGGRDTKKEEEADGAPGTPIEGADGQANRKRRLDDGGSDDDGQKRKKKKKGEKKGKDGDGDNSSYMKGKQEKGDGNEENSKTNNGQKVVRFAAEEKGEQDNKGDAEDEEDEEVKAMKQRKREKKKERKKREKEGSTTATDSATPTVTMTTATTGSIHETPMLSYLSRFYQNRSEWKFQKSREVHLFKHILSTEHIPVQYNAALLAYLKGLRGEGAKQRLSEAAGEVIKADIEGKPLEESKDASASKSTNTVADTDANTENAEETTKTNGESPPYTAAVEAFRKWLPDSQEDFEYDDVSKDLDKDSRKRLERRQRAELVWFVVHDCQLFGIRKPKEPITKTPKNGQTDSDGNGTTQKKSNNKKKKKSRTTIVELSSSSESDSSSSDSEPSSSDDSASDSDDDDDDDDDDNKSESASSSDSSSS